MKRGVSPIVSVVLMVAVAISIGVMLTIYITGWTRTQLTDTDISCAINTNFDIQNIKYNSTGFNNTLLIKLMNDGKEGIYGFGVTVANGTVVHRVNASSRAIGQGGITSTNKLLQKQTAFITLNFTAANISQDFGETLENNPDLEVIVVSEACPSVSSTKKTLTAYP